MINNIIHLEEKDLDLNIYRIYPLNRFLEILNSRENVLVKTSLWEDPFENFVLNSTGVLSTGETFSIGSRNQYFGQCWSYKRESDAMWRIYSQHIKDPATKALITDNIGIKVKSTIRNVFEPLFSAQNNAVNPYNGNPYNVCSFIGKVQYHKRENLVKLLQQNAADWLLDQLGRSQASSLMFKRLAFTHEKEIRVVYHNDKCNAADKVHKYTIDPNMCFEEAVVDPRISKSDYLNIKQQLIKAGFKNKIIQSGLYKIQKFTFNAKLP